MDNKYTFYASTASSHSHNDAIIIAPQVLRAETPTCELKLMFQMFRLVFLVHSQTSTLLSLK